MTSNSEVLTLGGRLRVGHTLPFEPWYLRPYLDADLIHTRMPDYRESGGHWFALDIDAREKTALSLSPMLEAGARLDLDGNWIARLYARAGFTWLTDPSWETETQLVGGPAGAGTFTTERRLPRTLGKLGLGVQLYKEQGMEVRLEYGLETGEDLLAQSGGVRLSYRF